MYYKGWPRFSNKEIDPRESCQVQKQVTFIKTGKGKLGNEKNYMHWQLDLTLYSCINTLITESQKELTSTVTKMIKVFHINKNIFTMSWGYDLDVNSYVGS